VRFGRRPRPARDVFVESEEARPPGHLSVDDACVRTHAPLWQRAAFFKHGFAKQRMLPVQCGSGSLFAKTRHTHGASEQ
jgi:hypothetical protein